MARILVIGATGGTGRHVVSLALEKGHEVTALVRDPARLENASDRLRVVAGSIPDDEPALESAVRGQDAVISTLGRGNSFKSDGLIARSAPAIVRAMERRNVRRLIFTSAFGVGDTWRDMPLLPRIFARVLLRDLYADKNAGEAVLRRSALDWTLVYPVGLTDGQSTGRYRVGERLALKGFPTIPRADVAEFLITQIDDRTYVRQGVLVGPP